MLPWLLQCTHAFLIPHPLTHMGYDTQPTSSSPPSTCSCEHFLIPHPLTRMGYDMQPTSSSPPSTCSCEQLLPLWCVWPWLTWLLDREVDLSIGSASPATASADAATCHSCERLCVYACVRVYLEVAATCHSCERLCVYACMRACLFGRYSHLSLVRASVCVCMRACVRVYLADTATCHSCERLCVYAYVRACLFGRCSPLSFVRSFVCVCVRACM